MLAAAEAALALPAGAAGALVPAHAVVHGLHVLAARARCGQSRRPLSRATQCDALRIDWRWVGRSKLLGAGRERAAVAHGTATLRCLDQGLPHATVRHAIMTRSRIYILHLNVGIVYEGPTAPCHNARPPPPQHPARVEALRFLSDALLDDAMARPLPLSESRILSYCMEGCMEGRMRDERLRYFPLAGPTRRRRVLLRRRRGG